MSCSKDGGIEVDENGETKVDESEEAPNSETKNGSKIVSGDPGLNTFLITSNDETVYTVNAETGEETEVYTFSYQTYLEVLPGYSNGTIYVTADDNSINAINMTDKSLAWEQSILEYRFSTEGVTPPTCVDGVCYASGGTGVVVAVDEVNGNLKWYYTTEPNGNLDTSLNDNSTPVVYGDKVYVFSDEGFTNGLPAYMHILDKETGSLIQKVELPNEVSGTPVFVGDIMYLPAKKMYAINLQSLEILWTLEGNGMGTPFVSDDKMVVVGEPVENISSVLYCIDINSRTILWEKSTGTDVLSAPIIVENVVYSNYDKGSVFAHFNNGRPFAVNLENGEELWYNEGVSVDHSPVYANGVLFYHGHYISSDSDEKVGLLSLDANTGEVLWLNPFFDNGYHINPLIVAENGVFGPSYYRGE
ncbi:outer membrane protein assembly factor BamB family protein [Zobellia barbeyronii]|uniref:outer membrane protein assembly factor BamB family protein n=1 Tax=Zobellia barbeyronii TaxID=2748009 RepID=UPI001BDFA849|nr:PQQ-binding-like beta-propeller repeat protein [Zobellia barbeyronii]